MHVLVMVYDVFRGSQADVERMFDRVGDRAPSVYSVRRVRTFLFVILFLSPLLHSLFQLSQLHRHLFSRKLPAILRLWT